MFAPRGIIMLRRALFQSKPAHPPSQGTGTNARLKASEFSEHRDSAPEPGLQLEEVRPYRGEARQRRDSPARSTHTRRPPRLLSGAYRLRSRQTEFARSPARACLDVYATPQPRSTSLLEACERELGPTRLIAVHLTRRRDKSMQKSWYTDTKEQNRKLLFVKSTEVVTQ